MSVLRIMTDNHSLYIKISMIVSPQAQFKKSEAVKLYYLIQQVTGHHAANLTCKQIEFFVSVMQENRQFSPALLNKLNPTGKELTYEWFATCVAEYFEDTVGSYIELISFNKNIRDFLLGTYLLVNPLFKAFKEQFAPQIYDLITLGHYEAQALQFLQNLKFAGMPIALGEGIIKMINHILSSIFQSYELFARVGKEIALIELESDLLQKILKNPSNASLIALEDGYKFLLFLSEATAFEDINNKLKQNPYFYNSQYWKVHLTNYFAYIGCEREVIPTKIAIEAFILNYIRICPKFADYFIDWLSKNPEATQLILSVCHYPQEKSFVKYTLLIFIELLKRSQQNKGKNAIILANSNIRDFQAYAIKVLKNGSPITVQSSIKLISQTAKVNIGNYYNQRNIGFILKALQEQNLDTNLGRMILLVFESSLKVDNVEVFWVFVHSKPCIQYIKSNLLMAFHKDNQSLHCICLQVLFHMVKPDLLPIFEENQLLQLLQAVLTKYANYFSTFISKIVYRIAEVSIIKKSSQILRSISGLKLISKLLQFQGRGQDDLMSSFLNGTNILYYNKQIFVNCIKAIYTMDRFRQKTAQRWYEIDKDIQLSLVLIKQLELFIQKVFEKKIEKHELWRQVKLLKDENVKLVKLLVLITDEIMLSHKNKTVLQKTQIFQAKSNSKDYLDRLLNKIYTVLTPQELQNEHISIFIAVYLRFQTPYEKTIFRRLPSSINYQSFKSYCLSIFYKVVFNQQSQIAIGNRQAFNPKSIFFLDEFHHKAQIRSDIDFKKLVKISFQDINHRYQVCLSIHFDKEIPVYDELSYYNKVASFANREYYNSVRGPIRDVPFGGSVRLDNYSRSRSPIRNTTSVFMPNYQNVLSPHKCQNCRVNPAPGVRFCQSCNRIA